MVKRYLESNDDRLAYAVLLGAALLIGWAA